MIVKASCASKKSISPTEQPAAANARDDDRAADRSARISGRAASEMVSVATDDPAMRIALWCGRTASLLQTTTAAAPSQTGAASRIPIGSATIAQVANASAWSGSRNIARGFAAAFWWALTTKGAKASRGCWVSCM